MSFRRDSPLIFPTGGRSQGVPGRGAGPRHQRPGLMCLRAGASLKPGNWAHPQRGGGQELTDEPDCCPWKGSNQRENGGLARNISVSAHGLPECASCLVTFMAWSRACGSASETSET